MAIVTRDEAFPPKTPRPNGPVEPSGEQVRFPASPTAPELNLLLHHCAHCDGRDPRNPPELFDRLLEANRFNWLCPHHAQMALDKVDQLAQTVADQAARALWPELEGETDEPPDDDPDLPPHIPVLLPPRKSWARRAIDRLRRRGS